VFNKSLLRACTLSNPLAPCFKGHHRVSLANSYRSKSWLLGEFHKSLSRACTIKPVNKSLNRACSLFFQSRWHLALKVIAESRWRTLTFLNHDFWGNSTSLFRELVLSNLLTSLWIELVRSKPRLHCHSTSLFRELVLSNLSTSLWVEPVHIKPSLHCHPTSLLRELVLSSFSPKNKFLSRTCTFYIMTSSSSPAVASSRPWSFYKSLSRACTIKPFDKSRNRACSVW